MRQNHDASAEPGPARPGLPDRAQSLPGHPQLAADELGHLVAALDQTAIVAITDVKGRILHANDKFCEISGYSRDELLGQDHRLLKSGVHPDELFRDMYRVIAGGGVWHGEFCNRAKSGRLYWVDTTIVPRLDGRGKVVGYTSIRVDITQRKTMEEALRRSEQLLRSTMTALGDGLVIQDRDGRIVASNPAAARILGLGADPCGSTALFDPCWVAIKEDGHDFPAVEHPAQVTLATGEPQRDVVMGLRKPDGAVSWVSINSVAILGHDDCPDSVVTSCADITAKRQAEEIFKEALAALPDGFVIFDRDDRLVACNDAYRQIYAISAPAIRYGSSFPDMLRYGLVHGQYHDAGDTEPQRAQWLAERLARHNNLPCDMMQRLADGRWLQVRERRTASGYIVGFRTDLTAIMRETARLQAVIDNFPGGISFLDADLNIIACNEALRTLLELPAELFENGLPTLEKVIRAIAARGEYGPGDVEEQVECRLAMARSSRPHVFERIRPNGTVLEIRGIPVPGGGIITTYMDITARHTAEQQRRDSEQQARRKSAMLEVTLAHMSQGLSMYDAYGRLMVWNDRFAELYSLPSELQQEGVSYKSIAKYLPQVGLLGIDQPDWYQRVAAGQTVVAQLDFDDGRAIKIVYQPIPGSGWVATHEDITDRIRVKTELAQQAERLARTNMQFDAALTNMSQGLAMLDSQGRLVLTNKRFQEMYGLDEEQLKPGTPAEDLVERYVPLFAASKSMVKGYLARLSKDVDSVIPLLDGRIIRIRRAQTSDGGWVATHEDITAQERSARQISYLAFHDGLTELANRAELNKQGHLALESSDRPISVLLIDLDRFKAVNDTFGHAAGDRLLQLVAIRMRALAGPKDLVARVGGDEFAILQAPCPDQREAAIALASRTIEVLRQPFDLGGKQASIGASIGIAVRSPQTVRFDDLIHQADLALYEIKSGGRNDCLLYEDSLGARAHERLELENDLREAIAGGQMELHYQPIVRLTDLRVCGMEALVRWRHPVRGLLSPDLFIPLAEETGLIVQLGEFVVNQACHDAASWPDHVKVAVNISPTHIKGRGLLGTVTLALLNSQLATERLELEVTETVLMERDEDMLAELHQLRALGISVALDDFGTGFSSLSHLRMFSFDKIKIDRSFVAEITERSDSAAIVCAVTGLARTLDIVTTAEGVETEQQMQILRAAGCTQLQGYLFGRPKPADQYSDQDFFDLPLLQRMA
uniref:Diguanylate cyclase/phosphodiesterase with PAS/PAC sensor(S) n=1 Tax=Rhodopseudomonas palustris (strain BisA53) TaxID=316055 RepID=Q07HD2_RHOP5